MSTNQGANATSKDYITGYLNGTNETFISFYRAKCDGTVTCLEKLCREYLVENHFRFEVQYNPLYQSVILTVNYKGEFFDIVKDTEFIGMGRLLELYQQCFKELREDEYRSSEDSDTCQKCEGYSRRDHTILLREPALA
jgi:hypothetical protein